MIESLPAAARQVADALQRAATHPPDRILADLLVIMREQLVADFVVLLERTDPFTAEVYASNPPEIVPGGVMRPDLMAPALEDGEIHFSPPPQVRLPAGLRSVQAIMPLDDVCALVIGRAQGPLEASEQQYLRALAGPLLIVLRWNNAQRSTELTQARFDAIAHTLPHGLLFIDNEGENAWLNRAAADLLGVPAGTVEAFTIAQAMAQLRSQADPEVARAAMQLVNRPDATIHDWRWALHIDPPMLLSVSTAPVRTRHHEGRLWLFMDITAQDAAERNLRTANAELSAARHAADAANRAKSQFLANMSHELRTPLNAIVGLAQVMQDDTTLQPAQRENFGIIVQSSDHLLTMINEVLDISKIEAGKMELHETDFDLHTTIRTIQAMLQQKAAARGLELVVDIAGAVPMRVQADQGKLRQVLINLLNNAIKFTEQGTVTLRIWSQEGNTIMFAVEDTGVGIAPEEVDKLFSEFEQTASGRKSLEGTGLGLPISRKFVQLMGGEISVSSELGKGTTFTICLPLAPAQTSSATVTPQGNVAGLVPGSPRYRVLIVDDVLNNRKVLRQTLQPLDLEIREAGSGQEALDIWEVWQPDLIWLDIRMHGMNGMEVAQEIRAREGKRRTKLTVILAITASVMADEYSAVLAAGCDDVVPKPYRRAMIFDKMAQHLGMEYIYHGDESGVPAMATPAETVGSAVPRGLRVLVVDDNAVGRKLTLRMLEKLGIDGDEAANGQEGLVALRAQNYPLVFMDMQMPVMDGLEAARRICAEWGDARPVIVALTGEENSNIKSAQEAGIDGWLVKPLRLEDLRITVERWLTQLETA